MAAYTTINDAGSFYNPKIYTGTGSSNALTGVGFQPDFTWIRKRSGSGSYTNSLFDAVRGATKYLASDSDAGEVTNAESLKTFDSDGFTLGTMVQVNGSSDTLASWNWKAGTTTGIAGSPSITPTSYSFNATSGFSVIAYTGTGSAATLPHGLGVAPAVIIIKDLAGTNWAVYHAAITTGAPEDYFLSLDLTAAASDNATIWNDTAPTSTLFTLGTGTYVNASGNDFIAYCFADVQGYSKFGGYTGNGDVNGPFIYTGFRPAAVLTKSQVVSAWRIYDNRRLGYNPANRFLTWDTTVVEGTTDDIDILSNGFKLRIATDPNNAQNMLYMAWAEAPFVNDSGVPVNAR